MLFNSPEFIFIFLPVAFILFQFSLRKFGIRYGIYVLILASVFFYGYWNPIYLILLFASILANFYISKLIFRCADSPGLSKAVLVSGITLNLVVIGIFKYYDFFIGTVNSIAGTSLERMYIVLPLGISFFTFQQIIYLVDTYHKRYFNSSLAEYSLFVLFFPQLIAGPIVQPRDLLPQITNYKPQKLFNEGTINGIAFFLLGLFKKTVLADSLADFIRTPFAVAEMGTSLSFFESLYAILGYTFQLYFDFSGYCDMAIGLGLIFGVKLPMNFNSPYKSKSIIEFWRRWHMTLSSFLRDYVYIPLGGNRKGPVRKHVNLMSTMLIGGLWHGANWTFVAWGGMHGVFLVINNLFRKLLSKLKLEWLWENLMYKIAAAALTFAAVAFAWTFFRAQSFHGALTVLKGLASDIVLPSQIGNLLPEFIRSRISVEGVLPYAGNGMILGFIFETVLIIASFFIVFFTPNIPEMTNKRKYVLIALTFAFSMQKVLFNLENSEFIYFQF